MPSGHFTEFKKTEIEKLHHSCKGKYELLEQK